MRLAHLLNVVVDGTVRVTAALELTENLGVQGEHSQDNGHLQITILKQVIELASLLITPGLARSYPPKLLLAVMSEVQVPWPGDADVIMPSCRANPFAKACARTQMTQLGCRLDDAWKKTQKHDDIKHQMRFW